jgi:phage-related baseplate assembly protein
MKVTTINPVPTRPDVVIRLSPEEADVLVSVLGKIGGTGPRRAIVDELYNALEIKGYVSDRTSPKGEMRFEFE